MTAASETLGREWRWLRPLAQRFLARFEAQTRPRLREVVAFLDDDVRFQRHLERDLEGHRKRLRVAQRIAGPAAMLPVAAAAAWGVPSIPTVQALAEWLRLNVNEVEWFADLNGLTQKGPEPVRHYHCRLVEKRSGGVRLIEAPKQRLKTLQRRILNDILDRIPPHEAVHGFVRGRNIKTFAEPHVGRAAVLRMDLRDFFPSIRRARVQSIFRTLGYPECVADLLGGIATTLTRSDVLRKLEREARDIYSQTHLAQGAPSSPALANACCYRLDCRLAGLARTAGSTYTRYADDLAFSGDEAFARSSRRFAAHVGAIVFAEGLAVNFRKTRMMRQGVRQHLAGLVVNQRVNVQRDEFDRLKAILTNCARNGPAAENRDRRADFREHLLGRVAFVGSIQARRGARLRELFDRVNWA